MCVGMWIGIGIWIGIGMELSHMFYFLYIDRSGNSSGAAWVWCGICEGFPSLTWIMGGLEGGDLESILVMCVLPDLIITICTVK